MNSRLQSLKQSLKNHGLRNTFHQVAVKVVNKFFYVRILRCIVISKVKPASLIIDSKFTHGFMIKEDLLNFSAVKDNELSHDFLHSAFEKGDDCYVITDQGQLASYGWYSRGQTPTDIQNLQFCFDPSYVYMYKGLTKNSYRGQRLHAVGMSWALHKYLERGSKGIVSYVESTNLDSLKSCFRMGYEPVGSILVISLLGKVFHFPTRSCRKYNIRLQQA